MSTASAMTPFKNAAAEKVANNTRTNAVRPLIHCNDMLMPCQLKAQIALADQRSSTSQADRARQRVDAKGTAQCQENIRQAVTERVETAHEIVGTERQRHHRAEEAARCGGEEIQDVIHRSDAAVCDPSEVVFDEAVPDSRDIDEPKCRSEYQRGKPNAEPPWRRCRGLGKLRTCCVLIVVAEGV